jgi:hypothetical protein
MIGMANLLTSASDSISIAQGVGIALIAAGILFFGIFTFIVVRSKSSQPQEPRPISIELPGGGRITTYNLLSFLFFGGIVLAGFGVYLVALNPGSSTGSPREGGTPGLPSAVTATPTATPVPNGWYFAPIPGPGCDHAGGQWARSLDAFYYQCLTDSLRMTMKDSGFSDVLTRFMPHGGAAFPESSTVTLDVFSFDSPACVAFGYELLSQPDYGLDVCQDGTWRISKAGVNSRVAFGRVSSTDGHFHLLETRSGTLRIFAINGVQVGLFQDAPNSPPSDIIIELHASTNASAQFKDFRITNES